VVRLNVATFTIHRCPFHNNLFFRSKFRILPKGRIAGMRTNLREGSYQSIYALADGDVLKFGDVTKLPVHQALTYLTFEKEKNDIELAMMKR